MWGNILLKKTIGTLIIILVIISVGLLLFIDFLPVSKDKTLIFNTLPFEEDFVLTKGLFQSGSKSYYFNVSISTEFVVELTSNKQLTFKLFNYDTGEVIHEKRGVQNISDSLVLKRGLYETTLIPTTSPTDGFIKVTSRTPLPTDEYIHMNATRAVGGLSITVHYEDELEETVSLQLTIKRSYDLAVVWNYTTSGKEANNFTITWWDAYKYTNYVTEIIVDNRVYGELTNRWFLYGSF